MTVMRVGREEDRAVGGDEPLVVECDMHGRIGSYITTPKLKVNIKIVEKRIE